MDAVEATGGHPMPYAAAAEAEVPELGEGHDAMLGRRYKRDLHIDSSRSRLRSDYARFLDLELGVRRAMRHRFRISLVDARFIPFRCRLPNEIRTNPPHH
jgi:hypothetical protein